MVVVKRVLLSFLLLLLGGVKTQNQHKEICYGGVMAYLMPNQVKFQSPSRACTNLN